MFHVNEEFINNSFIFDMAEVTFSKFTDLLKLLKSKIFETKQESEMLSPVTLSLELNLFNHALDAYKDCIQEVHFMEKEIYPITEIQDILDYFFNENFQKITIEKLEFTIQLIEAFSTFYIKNAKLRKQYFPLKQNHQKEQRENVEEYVLKYNALFEEYYNIFNNQENEFYNTFYKPEGEYEKSIGETFKVLGRL
jgi:hypothetical protein